MAIPLGSSNQVKKRRWFMNDMKEGMQTAKLLEFLQGKIKQEKKTVQDGLLKWLPLPPLSYAVGLHHL